MFDFSQDLLFLLLFSFPHHEPAFEDSSCHLHSHPLWMNKIGMQLAKLQQPSCNRTLLGTQLLPHERSLNRNIWQNGGTRHKKAELLHPPAPGPQPPRGQHRGRRVTEESRPRSVPPPAPHSRAYSSRPGAAHHGSAAGSALHGPILRRVRHGRTCGEKSASARSGIRTASASHPLSRPCPAARNPPRTPPDPTPRAAGPCPGYGLMSLPAPRAACRAM